MNIKGEERRKRRAEAQRQKILKSATRVFKRKGFVNTTTKEIADGADVAEGTIYHYFSKKRDLLFELLKETTEQSGKALNYYKPSDQNTSIQDLFILFSSQLHIIREFPFFTLFIQEAIHDTQIHDFFYYKLWGPIVDEFHKEISILNKTNGIHSVDERVAAQMIGAILIGFDVILNSKSDRYLNSLTPDEIGNKVADILINGLALEEKAIGNDHEEIGRSLGITGPD